MLRELKESIGQTLNGISYNIDIINACSLRCPSCGIGSFGTKRGGHLMDIDTWVRILEKAESHGKVRKVQMYAYSDPCLHPDLHLFIEEATKRNIPTLLSTMGQVTNCDFAKVVEARPYELRISFPGWKKMSYYQKGANPERFNRNIVQICSLPRYPETLWSLVFHLYRDNEDELPQVRELAKRWDLKLVVIPAIFMPCEKTVEKNYTPQDEDLISHLLETPEESMSRMKKDSYCMQWKQITLDANADVYLCQLVYQDRFKLCNFFDHPISEIQKKIRTHSFCTKCISVGGNQYQSCYADFRVNNDPVREANKKRHKTWTKEPELA